MSHRRKRSPWALQKTSRGSMLVSALELIVHSAILLSRSCSSQFVPNNSANISFIIGLIEKSSYICLPFSFKSISEVSCFLRRSVTFECLVMKSSLFADIVASTEKRERPLKALEYLLHVHCSELSMLFSASK